MRPGRSSATAPWTQFPSGGDPAGVRSRGERSRRLPWPPRSRRCRPAPPLRRPLRYRTNSCGPPVSRTLGPGPRAGTSPKPGASSATPAPRTLRSIRRDVTPQHGPQRAVEVRTVAAGRLARGSPNILVVDEPLDQVEGLPQHGQPPRHEWGPGPQPVDQVLVALGPGAVHQGVLELGEALTAEYREPRPGIVLAERPSGRPDPASTSPRTASGHWARRRGTGRTTPRVRGRRAVRLLVPPRNRPLTVVAWSIGHRR